MGLPKQQPGFKTPPCCKNLNFYKFKAVKDQATSKIINLIRRHSLTPFYVVMQINCFLFF